MRNIELMRAAILMVLAPLTGLATFGYLVKEGTLVYWHGPIIVCLVFGPVIAWDKMGIVGERLKRVGAALSDDLSKDGQP